MCLIREMLAIILVAENYRLFQAISKLNLSIAT